MYTGGFEGSVFVPRQCKSCFAPDSQSAQRENKQLKLQTFVAVKNKDLKTNKRR